MISQKYMQKAIDSSEGTVKGDAFRQRDEWEDPAIAEVLRAVDAEGGAGSSPQG